MFAHPSGVLGVGAGVVVTLVVVELSAATQANNMMTPKSRTR